MVGRRKDYKQNTIFSEAAARRTDSGTGKGVFYGLSLGLSAALGVHIYHISQPPAAVPLPVPEQNLPVEAPDADEPVKIGDQDIFDFLEGAEMMVAKPDEQYILQAGSFQSEEEAITLQRRILSASYKPMIDTVNREGTVWYSVQLGPFPSLYDANQVRLRLKAYGIEVSLLKQYQE